MGGKENSSFTRRDFVRGALLVGAAGATVGLTGCADNTGDQANAAAGNDATASEITWDREVDVLVVGSGAAGLAAGVVAAQFGFTVSAVDQNEYFGGCSVMSGGGCGFGAPLGTSDDPWPDYTVEDAVTRLTDPANPLTKKNSTRVVRAYAENVAATMALLVDSGAYYGYQSGDVPGIAFLDHPDEPGPGLTYQFLGADAGPTCGSGGISALKQAFEAAGGELLQSHKLVKLHKDESGRVVGGTVDTGGVAGGGDLINIKAGKGVVLGSGGWKGNTWLRQAFDPRITSDMKHTGEPYAVNDGSALVAAFEIGASFSSDQSNDSQLWRVKYGTPWYNYRLNTEYAPPGIFPSAGHSSHYIYVNSAGDRFINENCNASSPVFGDVILAQEDKTTWMIFDQAAVDQFEWDLSAPQVDPEYAIQAESIADLASAIGLPASALEATVAKYNSFVDAGVDADFAKEAEKLTNKIETGPFYGVSAILFVHDSCGGLAINENSQVIDVYGNAIEGLYAGGDAVGGNSTIGVPRALVTGFIAGKHITA